MTSESPENPASSALTGTVPLKLLTCALFLLMGFPIPALKADTAEIIIDRYDVDLDTSSAWLNHVGNIEEIPEALQLEDELWNSDVKLPTVSGKDIWLKTTIINKLPSDQEIFLLIPTLSTEIIHFFLFKDGDLEKTIRTGEYYPFRNRDIYVPRYSFRIQLSPKESKQIYFQIRDPGAASLIIRAYDRRKFEKLILQDFIFKGLAYGGLLALAIVYFWQSINASSLRLATYGIWLVMLLLLYMRVDGLSILEFGSDIFWWNQWNVLLYSYLSHISILAFFLMHPVLRKKRLLINYLLFIHALILTLAIPITVVYYQAWMKPSVVLSMIIVTFLSILTNTSIKELTNKWDEFHLAISVNLFVITVTIFLFRFVDTRWGWFANSLIYPVFILESIIAFYSLRESKRIQTPLASSEPDSLPLALTPKRKSRQNSIDNQKFASFSKLAENLVDELDGPMEILFNEISLLSQEFRNSPSERIRSSLERQYLQLKKLKNLSQSLKSYAISAYDEGSFQPTNINKTIQAAILLCRQRFKKYNVELIEALVPDLLISAKQEQLIQVLLNLFNQALDAMMQQNEKRIEITFRQMITNIEISIIDSAPKFSFDQIEGALSPFSSNHQRPESQRIGLAVAASILARHQGSLRYDSQYSQNRWVIQLPK